MIELKIIIVDDDISEIVKTEALIKRYFSERGGDYSIEKFTSSAAFLDSFKNGVRADAYVLDIIMPEHTGIDVGLAIKAAQKQARIIYMTTSEDYGVASYDVQAVDYCIKPCSFERIQRAFDRVLATTRKEKKHSFLVKLADGTCSISHDEICFVEYYDHRLIIQTPSGKRIESVTYREPFPVLVESLLSEKNFLRISASYVINMSYVVKLRSNEFEMHGGMILPISRTHLDSRSKYMDYMLDQY